MNQSVDLKLKLIVICVILFTVMNEAAAKGKVRESSTGIIEQHRNDSIKFPSSSGSIKPSGPVARADFSYGARLFNQCAHEENVASHTSVSVEAEPLPETGPISYATSVVLGKLQWAATELQNCQSIDASLQFCHLIKACAEAAVSLRESNL